MFFCSSVFNILRIIICVRVRENLYSAIKELTIKYLCIINESTEVQTLGVIRIQLIYNINILSKYSSLISHRPSMFDGRHIDYRSSKVDTSITDLRRSTHRSLKVNTSISEGRHIDLRKSTHLSSIFESRRIDLRRRKHHTYNSSSNIVHNCAPI